MKIEIVEKIFTKVMKGESRAKRENDDEFCGVAKVLNLKEKGKKEQTQQTGKVEFLFIDFQTRNIVWGYQCFRVDTKLLVSLTIANTPCTNPRDQKNTRSF